MPSFNEKIFGLLNSPTKLLLSGSTNGKQIKLGATATPGTLIHTAIDSTTHFDEVWLWANNEDAADIEVTVEFGGATAPDNNLTLTIPSKSGLVLIVPGLPLQGGLTVKAFAGTTNKIVVSGYVLRGS